MYKKQCVVSEVDGQKYRNIRSVAALLQPNKEVRFVLSPKTWINNIKMTYGSKLIILSMEVRDNNQNPDINFISI